MGLQRLSHAELRVDNLAAAVEFHTSTLGLAELGRDDGKVYLGAGPEENYDVALLDGGTGVKRFALSADHEDDLVAVEQALSDHGVSSSRVGDPEPGVAKALRFQLPSGHTVDIVTLAKRVRYAHPAQATAVTTGIGAPRDLDHITLRVDDVKTTMEFMRDVLGFHISDIVERPEGTPFAAWLHVSDYHHDVAIWTANPGETLDHLAWTMSGIEHIKETLDRFKRDGLEIEAGPGRHGVGSNIYSYMRAPGGNRYEFSAEMPRATERSTPPGRWTDPGQAFSAWNAPFPDSMLLGS